MATPRVKERIAEEMYYWRWPIIAFLLCNAAAPFFNPLFLPLGLLSSATGMVFISFVLEYSGKLKK